MVRVFWLGVMAGLILTGCAGFAFKYYGLQGVTYSEGKLLGPSPEKDLPFSHCAPSDAVKHPCVVMFTSEFRAFKTDYEQCGIDLNDCQKRCGSP